jgi:4-hydroxybenzoate polyprenyltransferase
MTPLPSWPTVKARLSCYERLMRLDKPIGILLLLWPTLWALWVAGEGRPPLHIVWIFVLGTVLMRSAGCVVNDVADRRFDPHVARTARRPIACGEVSVIEALILSALLCVLAFALIWPLPRLIWAWALGALFLAASYPYTKRFLAIPQAYLGVAFGFGIPMAFVAILHHGPPFDAWLMLAANVFWAIAYDTEYAMVDREDDVKIGIKTAAITFGRFDVLAIAACYLLMIVLLAWMGLRRDYGLLYHGGLLVALILAGYHCWIIRTRDPQACFKAFMHNNYVGVAIFAGIVFEYAVFSSLK